MKVTAAVAALAVAASASELSERQAGHNAKPCPNKPDVTVNIASSFQTFEICTDCPAV